MRLYVNEWKADENQVTVSWQKKESTIDHKENAKALLAFLYKRVPVGTRCQFGMLIDRDIPKRNFDKAIGMAYRDIIKKPEPKFKSVDINPDLLKVIKEYCPEAIKE